MESTALLLYQCFLIIKINFFLQPIKNYCMYLKKITYPKFIILFFTLILPILAVSQNSITTGSIRGCYVWDWGRASTSQLNNASITNNHIIQTHPNATNVNSITFQGNNSVLELNGSESVVFGTPTDVRCPKMSGSNVYYIYTNPNYLFNPTNAYCGPLSYPLPIAPSGGDGNIRVTISFNNMPSDYTGSCYGNVGCAELNAEVTLFDAYGINYGTKTNGGMCGGRPTFVYIVPYTTLDRTRFMVCHRIFHSSCANSYTPGGINRAYVDMDIEPNLF